MKHYEKGKLLDRCSTRHWAAHSEDFTGADSLMTAQSRGWQIVDVRVDRRNRCRSQAVTIYVFTLRHKDRITLMRVIANPCVEHVVAQLNTATPIPQSLTRPQVVSRLQSRPAVGQRAALQIRHR